MQRRLQLNLLRQAQRVLDLNSEVANSALQLRVTQQKLHRALVSSLLVSLRGLGATQRVRSIGGAIQPSGYHPFAHDARVLSG